ncbi:hypothetical protein [Flagellimonas sp. C4]|uniref:hypothetical protein n=1 Tax=Flagellimonas alginolytica TaxID=3177515 RepID=UPI0035C9004F
MKTTELAEQVDNLPKKQKMAILGIIDLKVENDMEKVLHKLDTMGNKISVIYWLIGALAVFLTSLITVYQFLG